MTEAFRRVIPAATRQLEGIRESLFVHGSHSKAEQISQLCADDMLGSVYALPHGGSRMAALQRVLQRHREVAGSDATVLADADSYSGRKRKYAGAGLDPVWPQLQLDAGLQWATTDSGYVAQDDFDGLKRLFEDAASINEELGGRLILELPVDYRIVKERADSLRELIDDYRIPYALMLGHAGDPMSSTDGAAGLRHVLGAATVGTLLRTDLAVIPAVACGAAFGAIGTNSSTRHIFPPQKGGKAAGISAFLPHGLSYHLLDRLALAAGLTPDAPHWRCPCERCQDGRVDQCIFTNDQAFAHSVLGAVEVARNCLASSNARDNLKSFRARAMSAQVTHMEIEANVISGWGVPKYLNSWVNALADV